VSEPLPQLLDAKGLQAELGITRAAAQKIIEQLPVVQLPGLREVWVKRCDVERLLDAHTYQKDRVPGVSLGAGEASATQATPHPGRYGREATQVQRRHHA
jgi:hypothetical protein